MLRDLVKSKGACEQQRGQLEAELAEFRKDLQRLAEEGLGATVKAATEDELVTRWGLYLVSRVWRRHGTQRHVQLLGGLRLDPHEQAGGRGQTQSAWADPGGAGPRRTTYFLIFSRMSAILPKRFCVKMELRS